MNYLNTLLKSPYLHPGFIGYKSLIVIDYLITNYPILNLELITYVNYKLLRKHGIEAKYSNMINSRTVQLDLTFPSSVQWYDFIIDINEDWKDLKGMDIPTLGLANKGSVNRSDAPFKANIDNIVNSFIKTYELRKLSSSVSKVDVSENYLFVDSFEDGNDFKDLDDNTIIYAPNSHIDINVLYKEVNVPENNDKNIQIITDCLLVNDFIYLWQHSKHFNVEKDIDLSLITNKISMLGVK